MEEFLATHDLERMEPGRHDVDGDAVFVIVADDTARADTPPLEAHRTHIDLQMAVRGSFDILWRPLTSCTDVTVPYDDASDIIFFGDAPTSRITCSEGVGVVLFPNDAHAPQPPVDHVRKAVFKIRI